MGVDPNEVRGDAEEAGLPGHEQDEGYRRRDPAEGTEPAPLDEAELPDHEQDALGGEDTGTSETNP